VTHYGRSVFHGRKINLSPRALAGQNVGVTQGRTSGIWLVTLSQYDLGYLTTRLQAEPIANPFGPKVLPMCSE
jgi:putative transposase